MQGKGKGDESSGSPDILSKPAMKNAYYICHNVQVRNHTELSTCQVLIDFKCLGFDVL